MQRNEIIKRVKSINIEVETNVSDERIIKFSDLFEGQDVKFETYNDKIILTIEKINTGGSITCVKNTRERVNGNER